MVNAARDVGTLIRVFLGGGAAEAILEDLHASVGTDRLHLFIPAALAFVQSLLDEGSAALDSLRQDERINSLLLTLKGLQTCKGLAMHETEHSNRRIL